MSQLLLKIMTNSYCRYHDEKNLITDCLNAITAKVSSLDSLVNSETKTIKQALSLPSQHTDNEMSVIMQEQTERSFNQNSSYEKWMLRTRQQFNCQISKLDRLQRNTEKVINIYKSQLQDITKQFIQWESKNEELKKQLKKVNKLNEKLNQENNELKDQITADSANLFMNSVQNFDSVFDSRNSNRRGTSKQQTPKFKMRNSEKDPKNQDKKNIMNKADQKIKASLKNNESLVQKQKEMQEEQRQRVSQRQKDRKRQTQREKTIQIKIRETEVDQQLQKWKKLSKKIDQLKGKLVLYEQQIEEKNNEISKLKLTIQQLKSEEGAESEEKRKLKTANTTLRGQKTVLQKQVLSLKKSLTDKTELCTVQQNQLSKLRIQIKTSTQTIKFQSTNITELQQTLTKSTQKQYDENNDKIQKLQHINKQLMNYIEDQQKQIEMIDKKTKEIEDKLDRKIKDMGNRVIQLEMILEEKNQCIVRMKAKGIQNQNSNPNIPASSQNAYLNQLVRVLTKKVADRDEVIKKLQQQPRTGQ